MIKIVIIIEFNLPEARCVCSQAAKKGYPLLDSPDPSKTQASIGTGAKT